LSEAKACLLGAGEFCSIIAVQLHIQDPANPNAPFLHEKILELCQGAMRGGGAFAFVSSDGVKLLLKDEVFKKFAGASKFELVVGIDAITNEKALKALNETSKELPKLDVKVFCHDRFPAIFHPKFCWFRHRTKSYLLTGSGNLTAKGLRGNWEGFGVGELGRDSANALEKQWGDWRQFHESRLKPVDDPAVVARAAQNVRQFRPARRTPEEIEVEAEDAGRGQEKDVQVIPTCDVLIAEIPRSGNRWKQANFRISTFRQFFGAEPGEFRRVVFQHVNADGELGALENRQSVSVKSQNYRFELDAAAGLAYPNNGRPVGVFIRIAPRTFLYRLMMPYDPDYGIVKAILDTQWTGRTDRMRCFSTNTDFLRQAWPNSPLWTTALEVQD